MSDPGKCNSNLTNKVYFSSGFSFMPLVQNYFHNSRHFSVLKRCHSRVLLLNKVSLKISLDLVTTLSFAHLLNKSTIFQSQHVPFFSLVFFFSSFLHTFQYFTLIRLHFSFQFHSRIFHSIFDCRRCRCRCLRQHRHWYDKICAKYWYCYKDVVFFFNKGTQTHTLHLLYFCWFDTIKMCQSRWKIKRER